MKKIIQLIIITVALLLPMETTFAEESGFSVRPIMPKDQIDSVSYFHFPMTFNEKKTISVLIKNHQKTPTTVQIDSANGFSNPFGNMNYTKEKETEFSAFLNKEYKLADFISYDKKITLKPFEEREVQLEINLPEGVKEGQVLGGIQFQAYINQNNTSSQEADNSAAFGVKVKHRYTIGILLELPKKVTSNLEIKKATISTDTSVPQIQTEIWNTSPIITKGLSFKYQVFKKGSEKVLFEGTKDLFDFAPVTSMIVPVDWAYKSFQPGNYEVKVALIGKENQKIVKEKINEFKVEKTKVAQYAKKTGENNRVIPSPVLWNNWIYGILVVLVVGIFYIGYRIGKSRSKKY
ncbi:DUF916 domain-containing protein [Priestia megaterium]|uniref:WxL protein peptidoglycan domain-containing protein n=1 Tax=Priestia megaterium TaxID=1404 RepID=UPI002E1E016E|nr:DUF916 domain-containing protein [Priestia megaterium]